MISVYSAVRTGALNKAVCASSLKGLRENHGLLSFEGWLFRKTLELKNVERRNRIKLNEVELHGLYS